MCKLNQILKINILQKDSYSLQYTLNKAKLDKTAVKFEKLTTITDRSNFID